FEKMKQTVDSGVLGTLAYIEGYYVHDLTVRAFQYDDWRATSDATPMVYAGCHFVDLLRWLTGEEPDEAYAMAGNVAFPHYPESDLNTALLRFPSGAVGNVVVSIGTAGPQDHSVRLYGSEGSIDNSALFDRGSKWVRTLHKPRLLHTDLLRHPWYLRARGILQQVRRHALPRLMVECFEGLRRIGPGAHTEYGLRHFPVRLYEHGLACQGAIRNFLRAIPGDEPVACTVQDSARTVLACLAGVESFRTNKPVPVKRLEAVL
ncbi:MAG: Gfo/Idh/MocA family oxidoreductase, partial [Planctomycetota bacterium]